ncbi:anaerobic ribonucleoside-triphosphate reductase activating protein [Desulforhopalus sp. 52FAK]
MIIGGLQKLSLCDYPGTPAIVIFLQGCNFACPFCHNRPLLATSAGHSSLSAEDVLEYLEKRRTTVSAVVISGGEPTIQKDLVFFATAIKALGYKVKLDTNGSKPETIFNLLKQNLIDYIAMDIKAPWDKYELLAGTEVNLERIRESINSIVESGLPHHFRTTHFSPMLSEDDLSLIKTSLPKKSRYVVQPFKINDQSTNLH